MRFLVDAQLPPALARALGSLGHQAEHVAGLKMEAASDLEIWRRASETGAAIITKDEDFILLGQRGEGPKVVWVRFGNVTRDALLEKMAAALPQIVAALEAGERVIELR